ncbi:serine/threonine protein kinase [Pendulispora brunnea]|uniref:Serine/threonine protein kinase n=1 Tax=Pendulispora brunnea TaxID=2905690 RepID=A0ABZ2KSJ5_9BACT
MAEDNRGYGRAGRIGKIIKGKWRVDARLGEGATATVYAATHRNGHRVALKVLHPQFLRDAQIRTRFMREAYVGNAISHPGVVRVVDDDVTEDGAVFLVMELLEGESFERRAERMGGRLPVAEVVWMLDTLLDVLSAAHKRNIVHRDIKPDNLFLTRDGRIKVLDFGFARMKEEVERGASSEGATSLTKTGFILGTPDFMSPEQAGGRNKAVDGRSDLWSAAATAFCLITGQRVHPGAVTLHQHLLLTATARARSLGSIAPDLPSGLIAVIDRALMLEPDRRWMDATAMRTALRAAVGSFDGPPGASSHDDTTAVYRGSAPDAQEVREVRLDESVIFVSSQELIPSVSTATNAPYMAPYAAPPIAELPVPSMARSAVPVFAAPDMDGLMRPPMQSNSETSRSSITARRIRPSAFDPYFSKWIFFLVIVTISAVVFIIGLRRKKHLDRHPSSFSAQVVTAPFSSASSTSSVSSVLPQSSAPAATLPPRPAATTPRK